MGNITRKCLKRVLKICPIAIEEEKMKLCFLQAVAQGECAGAVTWMAAVWSRATLVSAPTAFFFLLKAKQDSETGVSGSVHACIWVSEVWFRGWLQDFWSRWLALASRMAELGNPSSCCLSTERRQRDGLIWRNSRSTESRLGRSKGSVSLFSPKLHYFALFCGIMMIITA